MSDPKRTAEPGGRLEAPWLRAAPLKAVFAALTSEGGTARVVGGAVRNTLLGMPVTDIDIATTVLPNDVMRLATAHGLSAHPTGIEHGTVTVVANGHPFEVTTLRRDVETDGRRALVAFTTDWAEDAARRDFTINALYTAPDGTLFDITGGRADLKARHIRFIGDPHDRIREDYLRILRFFRFTAQYGVGPPDAPGLAACRELKVGMTGLSGERIGAETLKLVVAPRAAEVVALMRDAGLLDIIAGAGADAGCFERLVAIERTLGVAPDAVTRLAALASNPGNAAEMARRLRLSNVQTEALKAAATPSPAFDPAISEAAARACLYRIGPENFRRAARVAWAASQTAIDDVPHKYRASLPDRWTAPALPFRGSDVMALGIAAGPRIGKILESFENWWITGDFTADAAAQKAKLAELAAKH